MRPKHELECDSCGRKLVELTTYNAVRLAMECKCASRLSVVPSQGGQIELRAKRRDQPPAYFESMPDEDCLRETSVALRALREQRDGVLSRIEAIEELRAPVVQRERKRLVSEAGSQRMMVRYGNDPVKALNALLAGLDPDTAEELLSNAMARWSNRA